METSISTELANFTQGLMKYIYSLSLNNEEQYLVKETFINAILNSPRYRIKENLNSLANIIRKKAFINNYRRVILQKEDGKPQDTLFLIYRPTVDSGVTNVFNSIMQNIDRLNESLKKPFTMYVEGYNYEEIANDLKLETETVKMRILLARAQLMLQQS